MAKSPIPFNVKLLDLTPEKLNYIRPVTSLDYFENASGSYDPDGLFSIPIFGRIGTDERDQRFSYIDTKVSILHPLIAIQLGRLKNLYSGILAGTRYAVFDPVSKDFVESNEIDGFTGYNFFMNHFPQLQLSTNDSGQRQLRVDLINKYKKKALTNKILVMPAGLRDVEIDQSEQMKVSEHNDRYRKILSISKSIGDVDDPDSQSVFDRPRYYMGEAFKELYKGIEDVLTGKKGFVQDKWASRRVFDGTRNVITAMDHSVNDLNDDKSIQFTDTIVGLWQMSRAVLPKSIHYLSELLSPIFNVGNNQAKLVNKNTLKSDYIDLQSSDYDRWATSEGLEKVIISLKDISLRDKPIVINDHYLALVYRGKDPRSGEDVFKIFSDISELRPDFNQSDVHPISLIELIYLSGYRQWNEFVGFVTRYPVTDTGSCYPTTLYCKTTTYGQRRIELLDDEDWTPSDSVALEYPVFGSPSVYQDSMSLPSSRLAGLGAD